MIDYNKAAQMRDLAQPVIDQKAMDIYRIVHEHIRKAAKRGRLSVRVSARWDWTSEAMDAVAIDLRRDGFAVSGSLMSNWINVSW